MTGLEIAVKFKVKAPGERFAVYAKDRAVGYWHTELSRWLPLCGRAEATGEWLDLPPGELWIDNKPALDQSLWKEVL